ncbi:ral-GDS-related protein-like [Lycaon pictus]
MTAWDRAMVVEHWIKVAKACQILWNYSSMHAIISALQNVSIHHPKNTWAKVSRKKIQTFKKMCTKDSPQSRNLLIQERPSKLGTLGINVQRAWKRGQQKKLSMPQIRGLKPREEGVFPESWKPPNQDRAVRSTTGRRISYILSCQLEPLT